MSSTVRPSSQSDTDHSPGMFEMYAGSPVFQMARSQLEEVASVIEIDPGILDRLSIPKRALIVSVPVRMDDGSTEVFTGYRVQHSLTSGTSKGGLRYDPAVNLGEVAAL
ncbi:MAG: Glu/Leu/Phe/Val dehydrogenase dimerization domain-containing protein, partial [Gemmataceae bacterium]